MPEITVGRILNFLSDSGIALRAIMLSECRRELGRGHQSAVDRRECIGVDTSPLFPQIPGWLWQSGGLIAKGTHEVGGGRYQWAIERPDELDLMEKAVMLPERIDHQRRLIFLNGQGKISLLIHPWLPAAAQVTLRRIFMHQITIIGDVCRAKVEERPRRIAIARMTEHVRHQRAIAWPHIGVTITREGPHVAIRCGDDRAILIDLRAHDEQAAPIQIY